MTEGQPQTRAKPEPGSLFRGVETVAVVSGAGAVGNRSDPARPASTHRRVAEDSILALSPK